MPFLVEVTLFGKELQMVCGVETKIVERYWTFCSKKIWFVTIRYPCRKTHEVTKYCYEFSVVHENCKVFYSRLWGCCDGKEFKWTRACFGWFDVYFTNKHLCFYERLESTGGCTEGGSLPPGGEILGTPLDPGSVGPKPID